MLTEHTTRVAAYMFMYMMQILHSILDLYCDVLVTAMIGRMIDFCSLCEARGTRGMCEVVTDQLFTVVLLCIEKQGFNGVR